jgi:hypothetical protein
LKIIFNVVVSFIDVAGYFVRCFGVNGMVVAVIPEDEIKRQSHQEQEENESKINADKKKNVSHDFIRAGLIKQPFILVVEIIMPQR